MRGTPPEQSDIRPEQGIIPADAGNTPKSQTVKVIRQDHPRGCGEHLLITACNSLYMGSSPRMRGTHISVDPTYVETGIIPADAGNTGRYGLCRVLPKDHPRGCGEHLGD